MLWKAFKGNISLLSDWTLFKLMRINYIKIKLFALKIYWSLINVFEKRDKLRKPMNYILNLFKKIIIKVNRSH